MLLDFNALYDKYNMNVKGVIQIGVHFGEEHEIYKKGGINKFIYIEPHSKSFEEICKRLHLTTGFLSGVENGLMGICNDEILLFNVACGEKSGMEVACLDTTNQGMSSSLLKPKVHLTQHKEVIFNDAEVWRVVTLDSIHFDRNDYNLLNMDVQGFEDRVLIGAIETIKHIDYIFTEVNREEMYEDNAMIEQLDAILSDFTRVETGWASPDHGWGDACYIANKLL